MSGVTKETELVKLATAAAGLWRRLAEREMFFSSTCDGSGAFHLDGTLETELAALRGGGAEPRAFGAIVAAAAEYEFSQPCLVNALLAANLVALLGLEPREAIRRARVKYTGTDGVRGQTEKITPGAAALAAFVRRGVFSDGLCALLAAAFMLMEGAPAGESAAVVEDGRDFFGGRACALGALAGLGSTGCRVYDLGIAPTPLAPAAMALLGARYGAAVTASHNPASQNGVKFFRDGAKLLPEADDYRLSALTFKLALGGDCRIAARGEVETVDPRPLFDAYMTAGAAALPGTLAQAAGAKIVADAAHGAFSPFLQDWADRNGLNVETLNADMTGGNINLDSGVAHVEGKDFIPAARAGAEIAAVGRVLERFRAGESEVCGLVLDGDGDRGLLLLPEADGVHVLDGDKLAFLIARELAAPGERRVFAGTVESDLAVFDAAAACGLPTAITPVGDKWLTSSPAVTLRLLVGEESSGHLALPVRLPLAGGGLAAVTTGNGVLTCLWAVAALRRRGLSTRAAAEIFAPGVMETCYAYFVDKARFYRGSAAWDNCIRAAETELAALTRETQLPSGSVLREVPFPDDEDMLYLELVSGGERLGAVFARNSGTENKTAAYARGRAEWGGPLRRLALALNRSHIAALKDRSLPENLVLEELARRLPADDGELPLAECRAVAVAAGITSATAQDALFYALQKERRARKTAGGLRRFDTD